MTSVGTIENKSIPYIFNDVASCNIAPPCSTGRGNKEHEQWLEFGLPEQVLSTHPDCVAFLMKSGCARLLVMFQNSTSQGIENHALRFDIDGMPLIKMEGNWARWDTIKNRLTYDEKKKVVISQDSDQQEWNYISPQGLVPQSRFNYEKIYHIEQLSQQEYKELLAHAEEFWENNPLPQPSSERKCIFQVVSTHREHVSENWLSWLIKNALNQIPEHIGIRVIDSTGQVYSSGLQASYEEGKINIGNLPWSCFTTIATKMPVLDYEEVRQFDFKRVTSFTINEEQKEAVLRMVEELNKREVTFTFGKQNCARVTAEILRCAGVDASAKIALFTLLWKMVPSLADVPLIGVPLACLAHTVSTVAECIFNMITPLIPQPIRQVVSLPVVIMEKIGKVISFAGVLAFGASSTSPHVEQMQDAKESPDDKGIPRFKKMFRGWIDFFYVLFDEESMQTYHSSSMIEWQEKQKTTIKYSGEKKPKLCILPSQRIPASALKA